MSQVVHASETTFASQVLQSERPVLVDFWAEWCGPCRAIAPVLEQVADARQQALQVVKVNVDEQPALAERYGIRSIPALLLFEAGAVRAQRTGSLRRVELEAFLDREGIAAR